MSFMKFIRNNSEDFKEQSLGANQIISYIVAFIAIVFSLFQIYTAYFGVYTALIQRSIHLAFVMGIGFLVYP